MNLGTLPRVACCSSSQFSSRCSWPGGAVGCDGRPRRWLSLSLPFVKPLRPRVQHEEWVAIAVEAVVQPLAPRTRAMAPLVAEVGVDGGREQLVAGRAADPVLGPVVLDLMIVKGHYLTVPEATRIRTELEVGSGKVLWERSGPNDLAETECGVLGPGLPGPDGGYVFRACESELVFLPDRGADHATVVSAPTYVPELPNERDVDAYREHLAAMAGGMSMPASAMDPYLDGFREEPKTWFLVPRSLAYDNKGRLWVATTHDRDAFSYLDLYAGVDYAGTVRIRDRLMGYDLLGSTLAALVERPPGPDGIATRAIDWYRIDGLELGLR